MAGIFSKSNRPVRPGAYFNWVAAAQAPNYQGSSGIVAMPFQANWGPENSVVTLGHPGDYQAVYGRNQATNGNRAADLLFRGEGLPGLSGADYMLGYRMVNTTSAVKSSRLLTNTAAITALTLQGIYYGTYGNRLSVTVMSNARDATNKNDLVILDNGVEVERFVHLKTDITALAADINARSGWVRTTGAVVTGTALTAVTGSAFTLGADGTLVAGDYTAAFTAFGIQRFGLLVFADIDAGGASVLTSLLSWAQTENQTGHRFMTVVGGALDETVTTAVARSTSLNDPNFVNLGVGSVSDPVHGTISTSQLAPRIAGILARRGERQNLTFARLAGAKIITGPSSTDILAAIAGGVVVLSRDAREDAPTRIEKGITTFTTVGDGNRPYNVYSVPKFMRVMHGVETELTEFAEFYVIGQQPVNDATRAYLRTQAELRLTSREELGIVQPGWVVKTDTDPPPTIQDEFIALAIGLNFGRSLEQIFYTVTVG